MAKRRKRKSSRFRGKSRDAEFRELVEQYVKDEEAKFAGKEKPEKSEIAAPSLIPIAAPVDLEEEQLQIQLERNPELVLGQLSGMAILADTPDKQEQYDYTKERIIKAIEKEPSQVRKAILRRMTW